MSRGDFPGDGRAERLGCAGAAWYHVPAGTWCGRVSEEREYTMKLTCMVGVVALLLLVAAGCGKKEAATDAAAPGALGKDAPTAALLTGTLSTQLQQYQGQVDTLKASAKQYTDQKLNALMANLEQELKDASAKLDELESAGQDRAKALQGELQEILKEVGDLITQARGRVVELQAGKP